MLMAHTTPIVHSARVAATDPQWGQGRSGTRLIPHGAGGALGMGPPPVVVQPAWRGGRIMDGPRYDGATRLVPRNVLCGAARGRGRLFAYRPDGGSIFLPDSGRDYPWGPPPTVPLPAHPNGSLTPPPGTAGRGGPVSAVTPGPAPIPVLVPSAGMGPLPSVGPDGEPVEFAPAQQMVAEPAPARGWLLPLLYLLWRTAA